MSLGMRIGIDLGTIADVAGSLEAATASGAHVARIACPLEEGRTVPDEEYLSAAREAVESLRSRGIASLVVVDGRLTVAPDGLGAFAAGGPDGLAAAWQSEFLANVLALARALGSYACAWEILPGPNAGSPPAIAPERWSELVTYAARAIGEHSPGAAIIAGGLASDDADDGVDYLKSAIRHAQATGLWQPGAPPFDYLGIRFGILAEGGPSDEVLSAALAERARRLWRACEQTTGTAGARPRGLWVTAFGWDAGRTGEETQARNLASGVAALALEEAVTVAVWSSLADTGGERRGLYRDGALTGDARRPAWHAFRQAAVAASSAAAAPVPTAAAESTVPPDSAAAAEPPAPAATAQRPDVAPLAAAARPLSGEAATSIAFRIPGAEEVLRGLGLADDDVAAALSAIRARYGDLAQLTPGDYEVELATRDAVGSFTNEQLMSALYHLGGRSWALFERTGLQLSALTAHRHEPYAGPPIDEIAGLTRAERLELARLLGVGPRADASGV